MQKTLQELINDLAQSFDNFATGTATGGSTTTLIDSDERIESDNEWNGHYLYISSAGGSAPEGEERPVTDFIQSTQTLTVSPAFSATVASGDGYFLGPFRRRVIKNAINRAILQIPDFLTLSTTTITMVDGQYRYDLPSDCEVVNLVWPPDEEENPLPKPYWRQVGSQIHIQDWGSLSAGDQPTLEYLAPLSELSDGDSLTTNEPKLFDCILLFAEQQLHLKMARKDPNADAFRAHLTLAQDAREKAALASSQLRRKHPPGQMNYKILPDSKG